MKVLFIVSETVPTPHQSKRVTTVVDVSYRTKTTVVGTCSNEKIGAMTNLCVLELRKVKVRGLIWSVRLCVRPRVVTILVWVPVSRKLKQSITTKIRRLVERLK